MVSQRSWQGLDLRGYRRSRCLFIFVFLALPLSATTYYVDNCVVTGSDANNGTSTSTPWLTITHVNAQSFNPGDSILLQRTCTWREQLNISISGSPGNPITFGAYGTGANPTISSGDVMSGFSSGGGTVWNKTGVTTQPHIVIINGTIGDLAANAGAVVNPGDWFWTSNTLYVYATSDPSGTVVAGQRSFPIQLGISNYITVTGLTITASNDTSGIFGASSHNVILQSNTVTQNAMAGIYFQNSNHVLIDSNILSYNGSAPVLGGAWVDTIVLALTTTTPDTSTANTINNNTIHDNWGAGLKIQSTTMSTMRHTNQIVSGNTSYGNSTGIYITGSDNSAVHGNTCYSNTRLTNENYGIGITSVGTTVFYDNLLYDNGGSGIQLYGDSGSNGPANGNSFYRNVIYGHTVNGDSGGFDFSGASGANINNTLIYDNVIYGNTLNLKVSYSGTGNVFYNNTLYGATDRNVWFERDNPGLDIKNNIFASSTNVNFDANVVTTGLTTAHNIYYANSAVTLVKYDSTNYSSTNITSFEATALTGDPKFNNPTQAGFTLQAGSPAIDAGINLGATYQFGLNPRTNFPWGTLNQNTQGSGWEIGAFVFVQGIPPAPPTSLSGTVK